MTKEEFILNDKHKVRGNSSLMSIYIELYTQEFGKKPNCAGCTFDNDWNRFINSVKSTKNLSTKKTNKMGNTFILKKSSSDILRYQKNGKTHRIFANRMTEDFALEFLKNGNEAQIDERKRLFKKLPDSFADEVKVYSIEEIKELNDENLLNELLENEERKTYITAIEKRLKKLQE